MLHSIGVHSSVIALDDSFDAEALYGDEDTSASHDDVSDELPSLCLTLNLSSTSGLENSRIQCFVS